MRVQWNALTPFDLHKADDDILIQIYSHILRNSSAGISTCLGSEVKHFSVSDKVFGFKFRNQKECAHQEFVTVHEDLFAKEIKRTQTPR